MGGVLYGGIASWCVVFRAVKSRHTVELMGWHMRCYGFTNKCERSHHGGGRWGQG